ncbi:MAG: tRNA (adenosine(37)-N6)-threonylcarbamoyltransferase complex ATPase subunit type 1 TsaE [Bacteroidetes bacterium]|nr:tRNA (adenosine(37)-N6)-threonylcarbamoyltransferase complex ATPase subunit type 1 TsaE [Bacteroidota bacterium]
MKKQITTYSEEETIQEGKNFASQLRQGDVVALFGDLGSGKTRFAKGISLGLGITEIVASPTFTIISEHAGGKFPLYHFDCYRLRSLNELDEIGFDEYLFGDGICVIEWAENILQRLPKKRCNVFLSHGGTENERTIIIERIE